MIIRSISRNLATAFHNILRNKVMSLTSVTIVAACLFIVVFMYCVASNLGAVLTDIESDVQVTVFIEDSLEVEGLNDLYLLIKGNEHISDVGYVSAEENLERFIESRGLDPELFQYYENPLGRCYDVVIDHAVNIKGVVEWLKTPVLVQAGVRKVNHASDDIDAIVSVNNAIRAVCLAIIAILGALSVVIITNTIKLTIDSRKTEISIMKYIGSTNWLIRWPLILEGFMLGFLGAILPVTVIVLFYERAVGYITDNFLFYVTAMVFKPGLEVFSVLVPVTLLLGGAIGTFASLFSMRKYLDV